MDRNVAAIILAHQSAGQMTHKELLELFVTHDIDFVVIGGVALRLYNSPRLTHDIDLAAHTFDWDA